MTETPKKPSGAGRAAQLRETLMPNTQVREREPRLYDAAAPAPEPPADADIYDDPPPAQEPRWSGQVNQRMAQARAAAPPAVASEAQPESRFEGSSFTYSPEDDARAFIGHDRVQLSGAFVLRRDNKEPLADTANVVNGTALIEQPTRWPNSWSGLWTWHYISSQSEQLRWKRGRSKICPITTLSKEDSAMPPMLTVLRGS